MYPGRIALLLTALLSLINLSIKRPPSSGKVDRLQIWMISCIGFVFASILTYALILFQIEMNCLGKMLRKFKVQNPRRNLLDNLALIFFPILFAIYSFCYFTINIKWLLKSVGHINLFQFIYARTISQKISALVLSLFKIDVKYSIVVNKYFE